MFVGASLACFGGFSLEKSIKLYSKLTSKLDLNAVEIRFEKESKRPSVWSWEINTDISKFLSNYEVAGAHLPFAYLDPISPNPQIKDLSLNQIKNSIKKASDLGMSYTVMHTRGFSYGLTKEQLNEEWIRVLEELADYAKDCSILLTIENADFLSNLDELLNIIKIINSNWLKITFDIGHAHIRNVRPLSSYPIRDLGLRFMDAFFPFISNINMPYEKYGSISEFIKREDKLIPVVHIHDYNGRQDHLKIGDGKINFSFFKELRANCSRIYIFESNSMNSYDVFMRNYGSFIKIYK